MKITTKKSALALILAVLMLLSAVTVGASLFAVSAEEVDHATEDETLPEATLTYEGYEETGNFVDLVKKTGLPNATVTLNRCIVLTAKPMIRVGSIATIEGNGHTIYFDTSNETYAANNALLGFSGGGSQKGEVTIQNVNLVGQPKGWTVDDEPNYFAVGVTTGATGAIQLCADQKLTMKSCTMKHFYNNSKGAACFVYANNGGGSSISWNGSPYTDWESRGLFLEDTVISDNYALAGTYGNDASVLKTTTATYSAESKDATYGAHIYVSGTTRIEDNYGKNGAKIGLYIKRATDLAGNEEADNRLYVMENFTGVVELQGDDYFPVSTDTCVRGSNIRFLGEKDDRYQLVSLIVNSGTETQEISVSAEAGTETVNGMFYEAAPLVKPDAVTLTVMNRDGKTEIFSFKQDLVSDDALPAWDGVIWSDGENSNLTTHTKGTTAYTATWEETADQLVLYTTDNGATWKSNTSLRSVTRDVSGVDRIEILGNADNKYVIGEVVAFVNSLNFVLDFNNCVVNSDHNNGRLYSEKPNVNVTIINADFNGEEVDSKYPVVQLTAATTNAALTFENCKFHDWTVTNMDGSAIYFGYAGSTLTLKDVKIYNNTTTSTSANKAAVRSGFNGTTNVALTLRLAGDTQIIATEEYPYNRVLGLAAVSVVDDFDGEVHIAATQTSLQSDLNDVASMPNNEQNATVTEGKKLTGVIKLDTKDLVASDINGTLRWTQVGSELPVDASDFKVVDGAVHTPLWYYNDGGEEKSTDACVEGIYQYYHREDGYELNDSIEAYILGKICGDVATVLSAAETDNTVEIIKDAVAEGINITASCTVNGNSKTLTLKANNTIDFISIKVEGIEVIFNDLTIHGGSPADDYATWNGATTSLKGSNLLATDNKPTVRMNNCVITGYRANHETITGNAFFYFHNCTIVDNISDASANGDGYALLGKSGSTIHFSGKTVVKDNFIVTEGEENSYVSANLKITSSWQLYVGELTEGSDLRVETAGETVIPITVGLDENGLPYNNSGMVSLSEVSEVVDGKAIEVRTADKLYCSTLESQTNSGMIGASMYFITAEEQGIYQDTPVEAGGDLSEDNFIFNLIIPMKADFYGTDIVIKINGIEVSSTPLSSYAVANGGSAYNKVTIPVVVGMAELTAPVVVELQDEDGESFDSYEYSAKEYADLLISMTLDQYKDIGYYTEYTSEEDLIPMKSAVAALLQYGQMIQTFFEMNDAEPAMTDEDITTWENLGLDFYMVDYSDITVNEAVKATQSDSVEGVTVVGATLTMENEMSLRLYFTYTGDIANLSATVDGAKAKIVPAGSMYYIEAAHIGTAHLNESVAFVITDEATSLTYNASPMSYVYAVFATENDQINDDLKNACEALYYYFHAVSEHFKTFSDDTKFTVSSYNKLSNALDTANTFSTPRIVAGV